MQAAAPANGTFYYGRHGTPTSWALAEALTALEPGAAGTKLFPSGVAAVAIALLTVLRPGDELLMVDNAYGPTRAFCDGELRRLGIGMRYYDPTIGAGIAELIGGREGQHLRRAVALGHPIGCSGARRPGHAAQRAEADRRPRGIACLCVGGGEGIALAVETVA